MRWLIVLAMVIAFISGCAGGMNACFNCQHYTYAGSNRA